MPGWQDAPEVTQPAWMNAPEVSAGPAKPMAKINMEQESGLGERAMLGLKLSSEGGARYLEQKHGLGNVATDQKGGFFVREGDQWHPVDSGDKLNMGDVADLSGVGVAALPAIAAAATAPVSAPAGILGTALAGAGAGLAGSALQQAAGAATPGGDPMTLGERATQAGVDTALSAGGNLAGKAVSRLAAAPRNVVATQLGRADTPVAQQGKNVEAFLGETLSPGQISQRRSLLTLEGALRRSPTKAADVMADMDKRQLAAARARYDDLLNRVSASPQNAELLGNQVGKAFDDTVEGARTVLDRQARNDFALVDSVAGRQPVFETPNAVAAIDDLVRQYDVPGAAADATKGLVRQLKGLRDSFTNTTTKPGGFMGMEPQRVTTPELRSGEDMQRLLSSWGRAAAGKQKLFPDIGNAEQIGIAKRVFGALNQDLDAATVASGDPAVAQALQTARQNYKTNMGAIDDIRKSTIGRLLGNAEEGTLAPEQITGRLMNMQPTQLKQTFGLLGKADPELAQATKRYMLEQVMTAAEPGTEKVAQAVGAGVTPEAYSPARLIGGLSKSPVLGILDSNEKFSVQMLNDAFQRLANRGGTEGSPTAPLMWAMDIAKNFAIAGVTGDAVAGLKMAGMVFGPTRLAEAVANPTKAAALIQLTRPNAKREMTIGALSTLGLMNAQRGSNAEDVRPDAMPGQPGR
jgi:hypothetical protein